MWHKKTIRTRYNQTVDIYDKRYQEIQYLKYKIIAEYVKINDKDTILDVGSGTGLFFKYLSKKNCKKYGIDFSLESLKRSQSKNYENKHIDLIYGDAEYLPFKRGSFDLVFVITVCQNLPNPKKCLEAVGKMCKRDGLIVLSFLKKKFSKEKIEHLVDGLWSDSVQIINEKNCEDTIVIIQNRNI